MPVSGGSAKTCSKLCSRKRKLLYNKEWRSKPENKEKRKIRDREKYSTEEYKIKRKAEVERYLAKRRATDPNYLNRLAEYRRLYWFTHPEQRLAASIRRKKRYHTDAEYSNKIRQTCKDWGAKPENREKLKKRKAKRKLLAELYDLETLILENPL